MALKKLASLWVHILHLHLCRKSSVNNLKAQASASCIWVLLDFLEHFLFCDSVFCARCLVFLGAACAACRIGSHSLFCVSYKGRGRPLWSSQTMLRSHLEGSNRITDNRNMHYKKMYPQNCYGRYFKKVDLQSCKSSILQFSHSLFSPKLTLLHCYNFSHDFPLSDNVF